MADVAVVCAILVVFSTSNAVELQATVVPQLRSLDDYPARRLPTKPSKTTITDHHMPDLIHLKLADSSRASLVGNIFVGGHSEEAADLWQIAALLSGSTVTPLVNDDPEKMRLEHLIATQNLGRRIADISKWFEVKTVGHDRESLGLLIDRLNQLEGIEIATPVPVYSHTPAPNLPCASPNNCESSPAYQPYVRTYGTYHGVNATSVWSGTGRNGQGVTITNIEASFSSSNSDLPSPITVLNSNASTSEDDHGTNTFGIIGARSDGVGIKGIAYGASFKFISHGNSHANMCSRLQLARNAMSPGDVILLEMQSRYTDGGVDYIPIEQHVATYDCIETTVGLNYVVVEAAGNGAVHLDSLALAHNPFDRANDSGAIIVGAGVKSTQAWNQNSSYGSRVDVQGWGNNVTTTGLNNTFVYYGGTSSASAIVAGVVALIQSVYKHNSGTYATPAAIRGALVLTGNPQTGTTYPYRIGPLPDAFAAAQMLLDSGSAPKNFGITSYSCFGMGKAQWNAPDGAQWNAPGSGPYTYRLEFTGLSGSDSILYAGSALSATYNVPESG